MKLHANARLSVKGRELLVERIESGRSSCDPANRTLLERGGAIPTSRMFWGWSETPPQPR